MLYANRLRFEGGNGIAKRDWHTVHLTLLPQFLHARIVAIDYVPSVVAMIMPYGQGWRDMSSSEILAAERLLKDRRESSAGLLPDVPSLPR